MTRNDNQPVNLKRRRLLTLAGVGLGTSLAGCSGDGGDGDGGGDGGGSGPGTGNNIKLLTAWGNKRWQNRWENDVIPRFQDEYGTNASVEYSGNAEDIRRRMATLLQAGDAPEMMTISTGTSVGEPILNGQVAPITDVVESVESNIGQAPENLRPLTRLGGEFYMVPMTLTAGNVFMYRADVYENLGLTVPETWDDLRKNCEAIANSDFQGNAMAVPGVKGGGKSNNDFIGYMRTAGGGLWKQQENAFEKPLELWYDEEHITTALEFMNEMAEYSPDPSSLDWAPTIKQWASGRLAQTVSANAWFAGSAAGAGADAVAKNTEIAPFPVREGADVIDRGYVLVGGPLVFKASAGSDNVGGAKALAELTTGSVEDMANNYLMDPTRMPAIYDEVINSDTYQNADIFQKYDGHLLDLNQKLIEDIVPEMGGRNRLLTHPASLAVGQSRIRVQANLVNAVVVQGKDPSTAYQDARSELETLLADGNEKAQEFMS